jgi:hypothetical protein
VTYNIEITGRTATGFTYKLRKVERIDGVTVVTDATHSVPVYWTAIGVVE